MKVKNLSRRKKPDKTWFPHLKEHMRMHTLDQLYILIFCWLGLVEKLTVQWP